MSAEKKIRISQCMIVKNEERHIERALTWAKEIVDEQIVVDTGSTDKTVELAQKLGAKVYHFQWINDFAAAKNYAIDQATGDWILFFDADEWCSEEEMAKIPDLIARAEAEEKDVISSTLYNLDEMGESIDNIRSLRIFAHNQERRYVNKIHEVLKPPVLKEKVLDATQEHAILHDGYTVREMERKWDRNLVMIQAELKQHPDDPVMLYYLGEEMMKRKNYTEAERVYHKILNAMSTQGILGNAYLVDICWNLLCIARTEKNKSNRDKKVRNCYQSLIKALPDFPDLDYFMATYCADEHEYPKSARYYDTAFRKLDRINETHAICKHINTNLLETYEYYAFALLRAGRTKDAASRCVELLEMDKTRWRAICIFMCAGEYANQQTLSSIYDMQNMQDRLFLAKAASQMQREDLYPWLGSYMTGAERIVVREKYGMKLL